MVNISTPVSSVNNLTMTQLEPPKDAPDNQLCLFPGLMMGLSQSLMDHQTTLLPGTMFVDDKEEERFHDTYTYPTPEIFTTITGIHKVSDEETFFDAIEMTEELHQLKLHSENNFSEGAIS